MTKASTAALITQGSLTQSASSRKVLSFPHSGYTELLRDPLPLD